MMIVEKNENKLQGLLDKLLDLLVPKDKNSSELLPYKKILNDETLVTKEDTYQAFFRVRTTDLTSVSDDGFSRMVNRLTYLNRVYLDPYKIYSLTYPTETVNQGLYWRYRIQEARRELLNNHDEIRETYLKWNLKLAEDNFDRVERVANLPELMFVIAIYGSTKKELNNNAGIIKQAGGKELDLQRIVGEDLFNVVKKLMNPNTEL